MDDAIYILIAASVIAINLYFLVGYIDLSRGLRATFKDILGNNPPIKSPTKISILIPVLRESQIIADTISYFAKVSAALPHVRIVIICTDREGRERDVAYDRIRAALEAGSSPAEIDPHYLEVAMPRDRRAAFQDLPREEAIVALPTFLRPLTFDKAFREAEDVNMRLGVDKVTVLSAPEAYERKVGQLNFACKAVATRGGDEHYFAVYDADSRPEPSVFSAVGAAIEKNKRQGRSAPAILQQVSCYCKNIVDPDGFNSALRTADAIAQTRWSLGFEYQLYRRYSESLNADQIRNLVYCVGHGCYCSHAFLDRIGGFPTESETDDLALGYLASMLGEEVQPLPALDLCDAAPSPISLIRQTAFWYRGSAKFGENLRTYRSRFGENVSGLQWLWFHLNGQGRKIAWAWRGAFFIYALIASILLGNILLILATIVTHVLYVQVGYFQTVRNIQSVPEIAKVTGLSNQSMKSYAAAFFAATPVFIIRSLGPLLSSLGFNLTRHAWKSDR